MRKTTAPVASTQPSQKQLEILYARRVAIDSLIESLVAYDRLRVKSVETLKQKTA
jgi:hypothetical protein